MEVELAVLKSLLERVDEFAAKEFTALAWEGSSCRGANPAGVIRREAAGGTTQLHMWMSGELWLHVCKTLKKPISATRCLGSRARPGGFRTGAEQEIVKDFLVLQHQRSQATG